MKCGKTGLKVIYELMEGLGVGWGGRQLGWLWQKRVRSHRIATLQSPSEIRLQVPLLN